VAEKGYFDTRLTVNTLGGHSSIPPRHTSIGILASLLVEYEKHPIPPHLSRTTTTYETVQCFGLYGVDVPKRLKKLIKRSAHSDKALRELEQIMFQDDFFRAVAGTTQAVDLISGGVKVNALPESAEAVVNHRIAADSSVAALQKRDTDLLIPLAKQFNLSMVAYGEKINTVDGSTSGSLTLTDAWGTALEPAPITPTGMDAEPWKLLSGTIVSTYAMSSDHARTGEPVVVAPDMSTGNTDTRYYWKLTNHIFRYNHNSVAGYYNGVHTINEAVTLESFIEMIKFFTALILNADESRSI